MKILVVSISTMAHRMGGMEIHLDRLLKLMGDAGAEAHVLTTGPGSVRSGPEVPTFTASARPCFFGPEWWHGCRNTFGDLHRRYRYDAVVSEGNAAAPIAGLNTRPPLSVFLHGIAGDHAASQSRCRAAGTRAFARHWLVQRPEAWAFGVIEKTLCARADRVWPVAEHIRRSCLLRYKLSSDRIETFVNWLEPAPVVSEKEIAEQRNRWGVSPLDTVFVFAGVLSAQKGLSHALNAFRFHRKSRPSDRLVVIGDGPDRARLDAHTASMNGAVIAEGGMNNARLRRLMHAGDVFLMPTLRHEGLPYSVMEACAAGLAVVGYEDPGTREAAGEDARLVARGDERALAPALAQTVDPAARRRIRTEAQRRAARLYNEQAALERLSRWLNTLPESV